MHNFYRNILRFIIPSLRRWTDVDKEHNRYFNLSRIQGQQQHIQQLIHQAIPRKVVKIKMQVSSIGLPWLKNQNVDIIDAGTASQYSNTEAKKTALKWKKITDYTKDVQANYKTLRNININFPYYEHYPQYTWLGTRTSGYTNYTYYIIPSGVVNWHYTYYAFELRPVITK